METPEAPREGGGAARLGKSAEARAFAVASRVGRGDELRGLSFLALGAAAGSFICLFMPWVGFGGHTESGWNLPLGVEYGLLALALVFVESLALARAWVSRGSVLVAFCLVGGTGLMGVSTVANLRWGGLIVSGFSEFQYGAWLGLVFAVLLLVLAALRVAALRRPAP